MKVLVIQQKMIGDVLVSSLLLEHIKVSISNAEVHYMIHSTTKAVVENNPFVDKILLFDAKKDKKISLKILKKIKKEKYDVIIDVYAKLHTAVLSFMSGAKIRISYDKKYSKNFYTHFVIKSKIARSNVGLTIEERLSLLNPLDIDIKNTITPKIFVSKEEKKKVKDLFSSRGLDIKKKIYMLSIVGSSIEKTYPLPYMAKLINWIAETSDCNLLLNYIPNQVKEAKEVYDQCSDLAKSKIFFDILGKNLREFIVFMSCCDGIIGNDGGATNMAKSLNKPSYIIFSPCINKESWNTYEDGVYHKTVHLKDFKTDLFKKHTKKYLKKNNVELYEEFKPDYFQDDLISFVNEMDSKDLSTYLLKDSVIDY